MKTNLSDQDVEIDPRLYMAAERTFLAWIRTGIALMGFGFVIARFGMFLREIAWAQGKEIPAGTGLSIWIGASLIGLGILLNIISVYQHKKYIQALDRNEFRRAFDTRFAALVAILLSIVGCCMAFYLLQL